MDYDDVRIGLYNALCTIPAIQAGSPLQGKVFREWVTPADTQPPFLEYAFLGEVPPVNSKCAIHMGFEVLCFGAPDTALDKLADAVVTLLHHKAITCPSGKIYEPQYTRDSRMDIYNDQIKKWGVRLVFWLPTPFST